MPILREVDEVLRTRQGLFRGLSSNPRYSSGSFRLAGESTHGDGLVRLQHGVFDSSFMATITELLLWRKPNAAVSVLASGTLAYSYVMLRGCTLLKLVADVLLILVSALGVLGLLSNLYSFRPPVDPLDWRVSAESAEFVAALLANMFGATEGVLRVAASGLDTRLFAKVVLALYGLSVLGKILSTATIVYISMWLFFTLPFLCVKCFPDRCVDEGRRWQGCDFWSNGEGHTSLTESTTGSESGQD